MTKTQTVCLTLVVIALIAAATALVITGHADALLTVPIVLFCAVMLL